MKLFVAIVGLLVVLSIAVVLGQNFTGVDDFKYPQNTPLPIPGKFVVGSYEFCYNFTGMADYKYYGSDNLFDHYNYYLKKENTSGLTTEIMVNMDSIEGMNRTGPMSKPTTTDVVYNPLKINGIMWSYKRSDASEQGVNGFIYTYGARFDPPEYIEVSFRNVPNQTMNQFMNSLVVMRRDYEHQKWVTTHGWDHVWSIATEEQVRADRKVSLNNLMKKYGIE